MRPVKACVQCRVGKRKCDRDSTIANTTACPQCIQRNLPCSAVVLSNDALLPTDPRLSLALSSEFGGEVIHLVDLYFKFIHDKAHSLFHEPSFKASVANGTASRCVVLSIIGLSARFAEDPALRSRGPSYAAEAKIAVKDDLENICIENIQACILIGSICLGNCDVNTKSLYFVIANRMAQILNFGTVNEADDGVTREIKVRIWWTCFIVDTWASSGSDLPLHFKFERKTPRVPMDESTFFHMKVGDADIAASQWKPGLWGHMVKLVEIFSQIQNLHEYLTETAEWDEDLIENAVRGFDSELMAFEQNLEPQMRYSLENLAVYVSRGLGRLFIAFHLGYYHYYTLLFYQYLDHRRHPTRNGKTYANRCKMNATMICEILKASREIEGADAIYDIVGHLTVVSSSVLVHTFLFGDPDELPDAKRRLESNLESLVQLRNYWPSVELMINRLVIFQNNCMRSLTENTHRFDRWMVKFLLQHAMVLEEKVVEVQASNSETDVEMMEETEHLKRSRVTQSIIMDMQNTEPLGEIG